MAELTDDDVFNIVQSEILRSAGGEEDGDLAAAREDAIDRYMGEKYGDEVTGRSQVRTREVMETIEWIMPSLARIFCDSDNMVKIEPVGPGDEDQAEQESDVINHVYWKQNRGFYNTYTFCKDALLSKTGILKCWFDDYASEERETYTGLDENQLAALMSDPGCRRELIEHNIDEETGEMEFVFKAMPYGKICIQPVPPEHFGVSQNAWSPYCCDVPLVWHREEKTRSQLIEMGYDKDDVATIPTAVTSTNRETEARRNLSDEENRFGDELHESMQPVWLYEAYAKLDRNGDGIAEWLKVCIGSGDTSPSGGILLSVDDCDDQPFSAAPPNILTHKFFGLSIADLVADLQQIKTVLTRNLLDNAYLANNGRTAVNDEYVNVDDILVSRPGGIVRFNGEGQWNQYIGVIPHNPLPPESFQMLGYLDDLSKRRTGAGEEVAGLEDTSLASVNPSVAMIAYDASRMKIELIARILAEVGFRPLFERIHKLMRKHTQRVLTMKLRDRWIDVNPGGWRDRTDLTVTVGVGNASKEKKQMGLQSVITLQDQTAAAGGMGTLVTPEHMYRARYEYTKAWGLNPGMYWLDPKTAAPKPPPQPNFQEQAQLTLSQAAVIDAKAKDKQADVQMYKAQSDERIAQIQTAAKMAETEARSELERLKTEQTVIKERIQVASDVNKAEMEREGQAVELRISAMQQYLDHIKAERDRDVAMFKATTDAMAKLATAQKPEPAGPDGEVRAPGADLGGVLAMVQTVFDSVQAMNAKIDEVQAFSKAPKDITYGISGLIESIGGRRVARDPSGRPVRVE